MSLPLTPMALLLLAEENLEVDFVRMCLRIGPSVGIAAAIMMVHCSKEDA